MRTLGQQKVDVLTLAVLAVAIAAAAALAVPFPELMPWSVLALAAGALLVYWSIRWEITLWAWIWVLSYGLLWPGWKIPVPGFFTMSIPRLIFVGLLASFSLYFLVHRGRLKFDRAVMWVMLSMLVYCATSATYHGWTANVPREWRGAPYFRFLGAFLFPYVVFLCVYNATRDKRQIRPLLIILSLYGWYALYIAYLQYAAIMGAEGARAFIFPAYVNSPSFGHHFDRARGAFSCSNTQANVLILLFYADLFFIRRIRGPYKTLLIAQAILIPPAIFFTGLRSAYVAFMLAGVIWCVWGARGRFGKTKLVLAATVVLVAVAMFWGNLAQKDRATGGVAQKMPILPRIVLAQKSWTLMTDRPWTGVGFGHYLDVSRSLPVDPGALAGVPGIVGPRVTPGNLFLVIGAETGLIGLVFIAAIFVLVFRESVQLYRRIPPSATGMLSRPFVVVFWVAMTVYLTDAMFVDPFWDVPSNGLFWALAGLTCGYNRMLAPTHADTVPDVARASRP